MLVHLKFHLLALVFKFSRQVRILHNRQLCGANKLLLVMIKHFDFYSLDLQEHLFAKIVNLQNFFVFDFLNDCG